jgi:rare lipoprotein A
VKGGLYVQVAALSTEARARTLAASIGGSVVPGGKLYRVRTGPYADRQAAQNARDALARRGYGGANIVSDH